MPSHPCRIEFTGKHNHSLRSAAISPRVVNNAKDKGVSISSVVVFKMYCSSEIFEVKRMLFSIKSLPVSVKKLIEP